MRFNSTALIAATTLTLLPLAVQAQAPIVTDVPAASAAGTYKVETNHTRVQFTVNHMGFTDWYGDFSGATGTLDINPRALAQAKVDVTIPVASVSTTNATLDGELKSAQWFDVAQFPTIRFVSRQVVPTGLRTALIKGDLTLHGVTRPVTLKASFNAGGVNPMSKAYTLGFNATAQIQRSEFGVKTYVPLVGDTVTIRISAAFEKTA